MSQHSVISDSDILLFLALSMAGSKGGQGPGSGKRKQSWEKSKYVSKAKTRKAICRICQKAVTGQNYERHLKETHSDEWKSSPGN